MAIPGGSSRSTSRRSDAGRRKDRGTMESIYYVMSWACHRRCKHCYEERFRPYVRGALDTVLREATANFPRIVDHFPERMTYRDLDDPAADGSLPEKTGRIIL